MSTTGDRVRDVRDYVRDVVRAFALLAAGLCGTCGSAPSRGRGRVRHALQGTRTFVVPRAYRVPHIPHILHSACGAAVWRISTAARPAARPARVLARAFSSVTACLKEKKEGVLYGF